MGGSEIESELGSAPYVCMRKLPSESVTLGRYKRCREAWRVILNPGGTGNKLAVSRIK